MTLAYWCVLIAIFMPYLGTATAKFLGPGYGPRANQDPRAFLGTLEGWRKRANSAQGGERRLRRRLRRSLLRAAIPPGSADHNLSLQSTCPRMMTVQRPSRRPLRP